MTGRAITWFRIAAVAEAVSWAGLLVGMAFKYLINGDEAGVHVFGPIHGGLFLAYVALTVLTGVHCRWGWRVTLLGLAASIPPFATYAFEVWALRTGRLREPEPRLATPGGNATTRP